MTKIKANRTYLADILGACQLIMEFTKGYSEDQFKEDKMCQSAVERQLEVIGEATKQLSEDFRDSHSEIEWHFMAKMRNKLIHRYAHINYRIVWETVEKNIPLLVKQLQPLLGNDRTIERL